MLLGVTVISFVLTRALPGDPVRSMVPALATQDLRDRTTRMYGLDKPLPVQYLRFLKGLVQGDLGVAFTTSKPVVSDLLERFPASLELTTCSMLFAVGLGVPLGLASAAKKGTWVDHLGRVVAVLGVSLPVFWTGIVLIYVLFYLLHWVPPPMGRIELAVPGPDRITGLFLIDSVLTRDFKALVATARNLILPALALGFSAMAPIARMMRSEAIEVLESDYVRAARSLGLPERTILFRHTLKNALLPVATMTALVYGYILGGAVLAEKIFSWPGVGLYAFNAAGSADYPALQGFILLMAIVYTIVFTVLDVISALMDPRIRY